MVQIIISGFFEIILGGSFHWNTHFIVCKRLKSAQKVQRRIKDGLDQLHKRYVKSEDPQNSRGLQVLSIGRIINPRLEFLEGENPETIAESAFKHNAVFIERYKSYWQNKVDRRTLGVAVVFDTPGIVKSIKQVVTCHEVTMNNCIHPNSQSMVCCLKLQMLRSHGEPNPSPHGTLRLTHYVA